MTINTNSTSEESPESMRHWIGKRVIIRPGAPRATVGSLGEVTALQWTPFGWKIVVKLDKFKEIEYLVLENQIREE